jgi:anti-sigma B factor antagonist
VTGDVPAHAAAGQVMDLSVENPKMRQTVLRVAGEIDMLTTPTLRAAIDQQLALGLWSLVLDLRAVTFLGSIGLAALADAHDAADRGGTTLRLVADSAAVTRPIHVTGLDEVLSLYEELDSAV